MKLNRFETVMMNNPVRLVTQRYLETPLLRAMTGRLEGMKVLEVGCGRGAGTRIILDSLGAARVDAFDLDPAQIERARRFILGRHGDRTRLYVGSADAIAAQDGSYDAVVDYGIIHLVPDWPRALGEIARVLRPGWLFLFEEVLDFFILNRFVRLFFDHPQHNRFTASAFLEALGEHGLELLPGHRTLGKLFLFGAARRRM